MKKIYITLYLRGAELQVTVKLHENVKYIGWYRCSTDDCEHDRDKFRIAHVEKVTETIADNPNFNVYTNRTLVIKKVLPADGEKMFICIFEEKHTGRKRSTTILHVVKDDNRGGGGGKYNWRTLRKNETGHGQEATETHLRRQRSIY